MTADNVVPFPAARVRTGALEEHVIRITSYGEVICFHHECPCEGAKAQIIVAFRPALMRFDEPATPEERGGITLGALVAAVESHRNLYMPA